MSVVSPSSPDMAAADQMEKVSPVKEADAPADGGRFCDRFVFKLTSQSDPGHLEHARPREHSRDTPRTQVLIPPPRGSTWTWTPAVIGTDGDDARPNGIQKVVSETVDVRENEKPARVRTPLDAGTNRDDGSTAPSFIKQYKLIIMKPQDYVE